MKFKHIIPWAALGLILIFAVNAGAQPPGRYGQRSPKPGSEEMQAFESIKLWRMTQALDLSEEQAAKIFPKLHALQKERRQFRQNYRRIMQELAALVRDPRGDENQIIKKIKELDKTEKTFRELERKNEEEIKALLTPIQQAKFILFKEKFERDLRQILREMREPKSPPTAPRRLPPKAPKEPPE